MNFATFIDSFKKDYFGKILKEGRNVFCKDEVYFDTIKPFPDEEETVKRLKEGESFFIEADWVYSYVPESFRKDHKFYMIIDDIFVKISPIDNWTAKEVHITKVEYEDIPKDISIFDFNRVWQADPIRNRIKSNLQEIVDNINEYESTFTYRERKYSIVKEVQVPDHMVYPDEDFALRGDELDELNKWKKEHMEKFHKKGIKQVGAIGVDNFEYSMGFTSIGQYWDCTCTKCKAADRKGTNRKNYTYDIRSLG